MRRTALALAITCCLQIELSAASDLPVNASVYYPFSINRHDSVDVGVNLSLLYGRVGRIRAVDLAGGVSVVKYDARFLQVTGLAGVVGGRFDGIQVSGFANIVGEEVSGIQIAGFGSIAGEDADGLQIAGFGSIAGEDMRGIQIAGFGNIGGKDVDGLQVGGFGSIAGKDMRGIQIAGFGSIAGKDADGLQIAGFGSIAGEQMLGVQIGGFANVAGGDLDGLQIGGFANVAGGDLDGLQLGGFANVAGERMNGVQIGVVNVAGESRGLQVGVANVAAEQHGLPVGLYLREERHEIREFMIYGSNLSAANFGLYTEANNWYSWLSLGYANLSQEIDQSLISAWHFGRRFPMGGWDLGLDLGILHVDNEELFKSDPDDREAAQARAVFSREVRDRLTFFAGGGLTYLYDRNEEEGESEPLILAGVRFY